MQVELSNNKRIAKNTFFLYGRMIIVLLVSIYTTRVVLNALGVVDYGIYNVVAGFVSMFSFLNTAMINSVQRFYNFEKASSDLQRLRNVYNTAFQIQAVLAVVTVVLVEVLGVWYINNKMVIPADRLTAANYIFHLSVISLVLLIMKIPYSSSVISHEKMDYFAVVSIIEVVLKLFFAVALPLIVSDKLIYYGIFVVGISVIDFLLYFVYALKKFDEIRLEKEFYPDIFKSMLSFSGWTVIEAVAFTVQGQGLNILINSFFGPVVNAARGIAYQVQGAIRGFSENTSTAFRPQIVESYAVGDYERTQSLMFLLSKCCYLLLYIISLPIVIELPYILHLWLDEAVPDHAVSFTLLVLVNMVISSLNMPLTQTILAVGKIRDYQIYRCILIMLVLPLSWVWLHQGGSPEVIFWATIIITVINHPLSMYLLHRVFEYSYRKYIMKILVPCAIFSILAPVIPIITQGFLEESLVRTFVVVVVSIVASCTLAYFIVLENNEKILVKNIAVKFIKRFR